MFSVRLYAAQEQPADPEKTRRESAYLEVFVQERERVTGPRLRRIDDQIKRMEDLKDEIDTAETLQTEAERASLSQPTGGSAETLIRYSTTVDRQYYRALDELWKLQDLQACRGGTPGGR